MNQRQQCRPSTSFPSYQLPAKGQRMLFTGPDNVGDYRTKLPDFTSYIGDVMPSKESTSSVDYLCRAAPGTPHPVHKAMYTGGIGWGVTTFSYLNRRQLLSNYQIKLGEFRKACEDKITHRYQNPWSPLPHILDAQGFGGRVSLAWNHEKYDNYCYSKGPWASLRKQSNLCTSAVERFRPAGTPRGSRQ